MSKALRYIVLLWATIISLLTQSYSRINEYRQSETFTYLIVWVDSIWKSPSFHCTKALVERRSAVTCILAGHDKLTIAVKKIMKSTSIA